MADQTFFEEQREQSRIKAEIVSKYFEAWANVMIGVAKKNPRDALGKIAYIDLCAGKGKFEDGSPSTPLLILSKAVEKSELWNRLITVFNDKDPDFAEYLLTVIQKIPGIEKLKYQPRVYNMEVSDDIASRFEGITLMPSLLFIDPWGYKPLSKRLISSMIKDFGCDCILFFNYNRINAALDNPIFSENMKAMFGNNRADNLPHKLISMSKTERETTIINEYCESLKESGGRYIRTFCFKDASGKRTSHHLILISKHKKAYLIMKDIMAKYCTSSEQTVPTYTYTPPKCAQQLDLIGLCDPLCDLADMLLNDFAGRRLSVEEVYNQHNIDRPFIKNNYKQVLNDLEESNKVTIEPSAMERRMGSNGVRTLADKSIVTFPEKRV